MKEMMKTEMKNKNRAQVLRLLKEGAFEQLTEQEIPSTCRELMALRDAQIVAELAKKVDIFTPEMLELDWNNWNDCQFVDQILNKYSKKFCWQDEEVCNKLFEIACIVGNEKTVLSLMKQKKAANLYSKLAASSDELFAVLLKSKLTEFSQDQIVDMIAYATLSGKANVRLKSLLDKKFDFSTKNAQDETAVDVVKKIIEDKKYDKNKTGSLKKTQDANALQFLMKVEKGLIEEEPKKIEWKKILPISIAAVVVIVFACVIGISQHDSAKKNETQTDNTNTNTNTNSTSQSYNKDKNLVVKDGDTVNIDYIGYVDDVAFEGGNTNGQGTSLTIGSHSYIDNFEEQLIGHNVGDKVTVNVTFPDDYHNADMQGKDARFEVTINGIYE